MKSLELINELTKPCFWLSGYGSEKGWEIVCVTKPTSGRGETIDSNKESLFKQAI